DEPPTPDRRHRSGRHGTADGHPPGDDVPGDRI
ncbi:MAG: hypothetical protein AVDCRST_MAG61-1579, partial [uncultured Friedmanniella sp.]